MLFYHDDTIDVGYKYQVYDTISCVIHYNHWWNFILLDNSNQFLV